MDNLTPVILCFKWGQGYPCKYTNIAFRALTDLMKSPFRFVCVTDDPTGLADGIETIPLPAFKLTRDKWNNGMWPKLSAFAPDLFADGTPILMMDVDVVITRDLTPLIDLIRQSDALHIMQEIPDTLPRLFPKRFGKPLLSNSSVVGFVAGTQNHIFESFRDLDDQEIFKFRNDQNYIHYHAKNRRHWPIGWMLSFKKSLAWHFPVNFFRPVPYPEGYIVIFHGVPNPEDMTKRPFKRWGSPEKFGYFPVSWIKKYWNTYSRDTDR